ncbi:MAG: FHA domain-containing protein [Lachnospiraceae bacterium]|nr:FHA domain-containing protein [Lachnospiraceae bacterium]
MNCPEVSYRRGLEHNYIVIKSDNLGDFQTRMLLENDIPGLLKLQIKNNNNEYEYCYEISSLQPISRIYEHREIGYQNLTVILRNISEAVKSTRQYLLDNDGLLIIPEFIYADVESLSIKLIHYPLSSSNVKESYKLLAEFFLDRIDHQDNRAVMLAYDLFKIIKSDSFVISEIDKLIDSVDNSSDSSTIVGKDIQNNMQLSQDIFISQTIDKEVPEKATEKKKSFFSMLRSGKKSNKNSLYDNDNHTFNSDTTPRYDELQPAYEEEVSNNVLTKDDECEVYGKTVLLSSGNFSASKNPRLVSKDGKKEYSLEKLPVTIGKTKDVVDIVLKDGTVSRMHASIFLDDTGRISVRDLSSSNGTYVNGVSVDDIPMPLEAEDEIMFGRVKLDYFE